MRWSQCRRLTLSWNVAAEGSDDLATVTQVRANQRTKYDADQARHLMAYPCHPSFQSIGLLDRVRVRVSSQMKDGKHVFVVVLLPPTQAT